MISHRYKFIFVHIDKTAGNSISTILAPYCDDEYEFHKIKAGYVIRNLDDEDITVANKELKTMKHSSLQDYYEALGEKIWDYFKFCCIRNPYDRVVSASAFADGGCSVSTLKENYTYRARQVDFIKINGKISIDDHVRFENIQEDFDRICRKLNIPEEELPHKNKSDHLPYKEYYDDRLRDLVRTRFEEDIAHFGYEF